MQENGLKEGEKEPSSNSSVHKVDPGKPAPLTWQRKLNCDGIIPSEFTLKFREKLHMVWDAVTGSRQYIFEGHEAPVYSVCPHTKENIQFIFSTGIDGKIKAWLYDNVGSRVDYDAPGHSCTTMAYSADGTRLFSCGTNKEGESHIVEWNETEGAVKRTYHGLGKRPVEVVQFDTTKNRFLAAGDEFVIKFWDMDNVSLLDNY